MRSGLLIFIMMIAANSLQAQYMSKGELEPLWPLQIQYKESGWFFAPGLTRTLTNGNHNGTLEFEENPDIDYRAEPTGKWGVFLEVGRYKLLQNWRYFEHFDYSLAFKQLKGREHFQGSIPTASNGDPEPSGIGTFNSYYLSANFNLNHWMQLTNDGFLRASVGVNADYRVMDETGFEGRSGTWDPAKPPELIGQAHFKLGYGWRISKKWFVVPTLETPILNAYPWDDGKSTLEVFSSRYRPITLSVRFLIRNKLPPDECPPVPGGTDSKMNKEKLEKGGGNGN